ncbi:MAG: NUDIX hydrolase [Rhodospirillales bacterium]
MPIDRDPALSSQIPSERHSERTYPARPLIGVGVVVFRGDRVLLVRRRNPPRAGQWSLPGGLQHLGETVAETARREVAEETGVHIAVSGLIDVIDLIDRDPTDGRIRYHYTLIDVVAEWLSGDPLAASDAAACDWFDEAEVNDLGLWSETMRIITLGRRRLAVSPPSRGSG